MLMRCHWLRWNSSWLTEAEVIGNARATCVVWHRSPCAAREQKCRECLSVPDPAPSPLADSWLRLAWPTCSGKKLLHMCFEPSVAVGLLSILWHPVWVCHRGTVAQLRGTACFHTQPVSLWARLQCLFVPSLTARWKSSYHRQRERNILQVCNSLKHWTWFRMSLLSGRKKGDVQTVDSSNAAVEFGSISTD